MKRLLALAAALSLCAGCEQAPGSASPLPSRRTTSEGLRNSDPVSAPIIAFDNWLADYRRGEAAELDGVALAKARRDALRAMISADPERALELSLPSSS